MNNNFKQQTASDSYTCNTPVVLIIFNRPDTTEHVFHAIRKAQPPKLFIISDGPRSHKDGELSLCNAVRDIVDNIDWQCEVYKNYSDTNLGCKNRITSGLEWVFDQVPEAIILEDDCLPDPSFFRFCDEMLERYREDSRISHIAGSNFQFNISRTKYDYYFSRYTHVWGWASWRRAWSFYDKDISDLPELISNGDLRNIFPDRKEYSYWKKIFTDVYNGKIDTWDYQWALCSMSQSMLSIIPNVNLVANIGHDANASHTRGRTIFSNMPVTCLQFPLSHPDRMVINTEADSYTRKWMFTKSIFIRILRIIRAYI